MIDIDKKLFKQTNSIKEILLSSLSKRKLSSKSKYSQSFISNSIKEKDLSIYSNDHFHSLSNTIESEQQSQLTNLDFIQSSANFIYPNLKIISSGYFFNRNNDKEKNLIYLFSNKLSPNKNIPLVYLGSEYFLRKPINFQCLKYPLTTNEYVEPLIDLFQNRLQFIKEIPQLNNLSNYRFLPQTISGLIFFDSILNQSNYHLCHQLRQNKFTIKDLLYMSQRENNIIQINALNDKRYHQLKNQLTNIYNY